MGTKLTCIGAQYWQEWLLQQSLHLLLQLLVHAVMTSTHHIPNGVLWVQYQHSPFIGVDCMLQSSHIALCFAFKSVNVHAGHLAIKPWL